MTKIFRMTLLTSLVALPILGCTPTEAPPKTDLDTFCEHAFPIYLSTGEHLDDVNADKLMAMDEYGIKHCKWN